MSAFSDFLVKTLLPTIEAVGESKLVDLLQKLHDADEEKYKAAVIAGHAFIQPLIEFVSKTDTPIDDGLVSAINESILLSAVKNSIEL